MKYSEKIVNKLNELLVKTYEAEQVYNLGAERSEKPLIKNILKGMEQQRRSFILELQKEIRAYGHLPSKQEDLQAPASGNSLATPDEVATMKRSSLQLYDCLLEDPGINFPTPTELILINQREGILASKNSCCP